MPGGTPPAGTLPDLGVEVQDMPEGGFGWFLIRSLVDEMTYERCNTGNCLMLCIHDLRDAGAGPA